MNVGREGGESDEAGGEHDGPDVVAELGHEGLAGGQLGAQASDEGDLLQAGGGRGEGVGGEVLG